MTHLEIFKTVEPLIPAELLEKYGHLTYGEMAELPELEQWRDVLLRAEREWTRITPREAMPFG